MRGGCYDDVRNGAAAWEKKGAQTETYGGRMVKVILPVLTLTTLHAASMLLPFLHSVPTALSVLSVISPCRERLLAIV